jgi:NADPH-dependent glutamate synthase beta subunit-like oxidoreductase
MEHAQGESVDAPDEHPKVYAAGDYVTGSANVSTAMGWGKKAAKMIDRR